MKFSSLSVALILSAGLAIGCDEAKDAASSVSDATRDAASSVAEGTGDAADTLKNQTAKASEALEEAGAEAYEAGKEKIDATLEASQKKIDEAVESGKAKLHELTEPAEDTAAPGAEGVAPEIEAPASSGTDTPATNTESAAGGVTLGSLTEGMSLSSAQADSAIAQIKNLIGEKNYDTAKQWISKLEGVELPEGYAEQLAGLKSLLEKAQGAGDLLKGLGN